MKTCTKCKIEKSIPEFSKEKARKDGLKAQCKVCDQLYKQANKEHIAATNKQYRLDNKERIKQYYENNKEYYSTQGKRWYQDNKEHISEWGKQYRQSAKGKAVKKATAHNRRAQERSNGGKHTGAEILALFDLQSGVCPYCEVKLYKTGKNIFHTDHITPLSKGGTNDISNIQLLCPKCNMSKHDKSPEDFASEFNKLF